MKIIKTLYDYLKWSMVPVLLLACFFQAGCDRRQQSPQPPLAPEVATVTLQFREVILTTELPGRASAFLIAEIRPQVSGLILKRLFTEGSDVEAGQVLYEIDPAPFKAALDNAEASLGRAEAGLTSTRLRAERYSELLVDKAVSRQEYDDAAATLKQAEAEIQYWKAMVQTARINLRYTRVTAPISGRIGRSGITDGAIVTAYQPVALATIQQLDPIYVDVPQSTTELLRLKRRLEDRRLKRDGKGLNKVRLFLEDGTTYQREGKLQFSDVTVDPTTGSVNLRIIFPNPEGILLPGMFVRAVIQDDISKQAVLVPQQAVSRDRKGRPFALLVDAEGKVIQRMITLGRAMGADWLVLSGLVPGDQVIVEGLQRVRPGSAVKAVPFNENINRRKSDARPQKPTDGGN